MNSPLQKNLHIYAGSRYKKDLKNILMGFEKVICTLQHLNNDKPMYHTCKQTVHNRSRSSRKKYRPSPSAEKE